MTQEYPTFLQMKLRALQLPREEIARHASVSINNRHRCQACFTCACVEALESLREADNCTNEELDAASDWLDQQRT